MKSLSLALAASLAAISCAHGQVYYDTKGHRVEAFVPLNCPTGGGQCTGTSSGTGGGGGAITAADGAIVNLGSSTDTSASNTLLGLMKLLNSTASGPIPGQAAWSSGVAAVNIGGTSGVGPSKSAIVENPQLNGCRAALAALATSATDGQKIELMCTKEGKIIVKPYAPPELDWRGSISSTGTTAVTFSNSSNTTLKTYVTGVQCGRTDSGTSGSAIAPITVTLNDTAATPIVIPALGGGGGNNMPFPTPLVLSAVNTSLTFTSDTAITTVKCSAQGYFGP